MCWAECSRKRENEWHGAKVSYSKANSRQYNIAGMIERMWMKANVVWSRLKRGNLELRNTTKVEYEVGSEV